MSNSKSKNNDRTIIKYDSSFLNLGITTVGLLSPIVYYNNFDFNKSQDFFEPILLCILTLLLVTFDTLQNCKNYTQDLGTSKIMKSFTRASIIVTIFLTGIMIAYRIGIFEINTDLLIIFNTQKNLVKLDDMNTKFTTIFNLINNRLKLPFKLSFLSLRQYVLLYDTAYVFQVIANSLKLFLNKNEDKLLEKRKKRIESRQKRKQHKTKITNI